MLYNQPLATRFGTDLVRHIDPAMPAIWDNLDFAVAWVRASGMAYLSAPMARFLKHGGRLSFIVGIDLKNTTSEGLGALLDLEQHGACETFVYHNEANSVFHPKLYLWRNIREARLIVGSNNLTQSGLYVNVEAGLQIDTKVTAPVVVQTLDALSSWKDTATGLAKRLNADLLDKLRKGGYVPAEADTQNAIRREKATRAGKGAKPIFGSRQFVPPPRPDAKPKTVSTKVASSPRSTTPAAAAPAPIAPAGTVLLMRLRKASETARPTQTQIPIRLVETFFSGAANVRSTHDNELHQITTASARGKRNTMKLEIPEMREFAQPVARFEQTAGGMVYEAYDVGTPKGNQILEALEEGRGTGETQLTISDAPKATWWRFI